MLGEDSEVPLAQYGTSNAAQMKTVYRHGLGERYGRLMQTIAGIHYNFSMGDEFWSFWYGREGEEGESLELYKNRRYFDLIRNFRRNFWLLLYLFGASPAVCRSFVKHRSHALEAFGEDDHSLHTPFATSLRMGDLGYQSSAQDSLIICYNNLDNYIQTLCKAITQPHDEYVKMGEKNEEGQYRQLNTSLLQIENEFYSTIRPKRTSHSGETALSALQSRGVEYIEVRCVDLNPYEPLGINTEQMYFLDVFLLYCLLDSSEEATPEKYQRSLENQRRMVYEGRDPNMRLLSSIGEQSLPQWGHALLDEMLLAAALLDKSYDTLVYSEAVIAQRAKLDNPSLTPSAKILSDMEDNGETFFRLAMRLSVEHSRAYLDEQLSAEKQSLMESIAAESLQKQKELEALPQQDFERYVSDYYAQYICNKNPFA
jgi:glutamate--cysteine ligase